MPIDDGTELAINMEGVRLGAYRIEREIGRGGMGTVYLATRDDAQFEKQVAIKVVKLGMTTDDVLERFRRERQILANLDHPNIARLIDGGTAPDGRPFFVMEYVAGRPVNHYITEQQLSMRERCKLFLPVCEAVAHAHRNLVVHRDLKPSNILITNDGVPKLLDFGVAQLLTEHSDGDTRKVVRPLTPEYASPEQIRGMPVSTASDVYSLGAVLFELLTGKQAQFLTAKTPAGMERIICQQEPERPSELYAGVEADLENIVLMALRKEPSRRYQSVDQFAEDIRRYLSGRPVTARQNSLSYRSAKFVSRYRWHLSAAALVFLSLFTSIIVALGQARKADTLRQVAETLRVKADGDRARADADARRAQLARTAEAQQHALADEKRLDAESARKSVEQRTTQLMQLSDRALFDVHSAIETLPGAMLARKEIVKTTLTFLEQLQKGSGLDDGMRYVLSSAYNKVGDIQGDPARASLGDPAEALASYRQAELLLKPLYERHRDEARLIFSWIELQASVASIFVNTGKAQEALAIYERILPDAQRLAVLKPNDPKLLSQEAAIHSRMINILRGRNNTQALAHAREQVRLIEPLAKRFPQFALKQELSTGYSQLAAMIGEDEDQAQAAHYYELSLQIREGLLAEQPQNTVVRRGLIIAYGNYASHLASPWATNIGHPDKALVYLDKAVTLARELVSADPQNATAQHDLAAILIRRGTMVGTQRTEQESLKELDEAINLLDTQMKRSGSNPRIIGQITLAREYAGRLLTNMRQYSNAELYLRKSLEQSLALRQTDPGSNAAATQAVASAQALAELLAHKGEAAAATEFAQNSIQIANEVLAANPISNTAKMQLSKCWVAMARVKQLLGDKAASKEAAKRAIIIWKTVSDPGFIRVQQKFIRELEQLIDDPK